MAANCAFSFNYSSPSRSRRQRKTQDEANPQHTSKIQQGHLLTIITNFSMTGISLFIWGAVFVSVNLLFVFICIQPSVKKLNSLYAKCRLLLIVVRIQRAVLVTEGHFNKSMNRIQTYGRWARKLIKTPNRTKPIIYNHSKFTIYPLFNDMIRMQCKGLWDSD